MKKLFMVFGIMYSLASYSQDDAYRKLAEKMGQKMKDSINLTSQQKTSIVNINLDLAHQKSLARLHHSDSLGYYFQKIENTRDTSYSTILSPDQYLMYKRKKRNLINNN